MESVKKKSELINIFASAWHIPILIIGKYSHIELPFTPIKGTNYDSSLSHVQHNFSYNITPYYCILILNTIICNL